MIKQADGTQKPHGTSAELSMYSTGMEVLRLAFPISCISQIDSKILDAICSARRVRCP